MNERLDVKKTLKLYINGAFVRSESGRSFEVLDASKVFYANAALASRKDVRDAVKAAREAQELWQHSTAYNRGQILYRLAELCETRRKQLEEELVRIEGASTGDAKREIDIAIDRLVWYAGWADKISSVLGGHNQVASPFFNFSVVEPTGVIGIISHKQSSTLSLISQIAPAITTGNTCIVVASPQNPVSAITLAEIAATSDVPAGVLNILTGDYHELTSWIAEHLDVDGIDVTGIDEPDLRTSMAQRASVNVKRVLTKDTAEFHHAPTTHRLKFWTEIKTVWHPIGS